MSKTGQVSQLTGHLAASSGYQWIGGVLLQWGTVATNLGGPASGPTNFVIPFPTNIFNVTMVPTGNYTNPPQQGVALTFYYDPTNTTLSSFRWFAQNSSNKYTGFTWLAIGN